MIYIYIYCDLHIIYHYIYVMLCHTATISTGLHRTPPEAEGSELGRLSLAQRLERSRGTWVRVTGKSDISSRNINDII